MPQHVARSEAHDASPLARLSAQMMYYRLRFEAVQTAVEAELSLAWGVYRVHMAHAGLLLAGVDGEQMAHRVLHAHSRLKMQRPGARPTPGPLTLHSMYRDTCIPLSQEAPTTGKGETELPRSKNTSKVCRH